MNGWTGQYLAVLLERLADLFPIGRQRGDRHRLRILELLVRRQVLLALL